MQNLPGKTAFITGGASGIGLGMAQAMLGAGMNVVIADVRADHLEAARAELNNDGRVLALELDVTDRAAYARAADAAEARFNKIHLLCNNAGIAVIGPTELATFADWDWVMGVNLGGTINGIVTILPRIKRHGEGGHIVNTASMSGLMPHPGATLYGTSKGAAVHMMECMRAELEPQGIICSAFCPAPCSPTSPMLEGHGRRTWHKPATPKPTSVASRETSSSTFTAPRKKSGSGC